MNALEHFDKLYGHLPPDDDAMWTFVSGWNSAMSEAMQGVNAMPFGNDTRASFAIYFQQMMLVNPDDVKPAPVQEPVAWVDLLKQAEEVVRSKSLWKKYIDGTPLANDIAVWMANFVQEHTTPPGGRQSEDCLTAAQEDIQRLSALVRAQQITIDKLEQARSAPVQEPVAVIGSGFQLLYCREDWAKGLKIGDKLYTTPPAQPAPVQEQIVALIDENQRLRAELKFNTPPAAQRQCKWPTCQSEEYQRALAEQINQELVTGAAQRQWVGLTDEEFEDIELGCRSTSSGKIEAMQKVEAKLKEKNT